MFLSLYINYRGIYMNMKTFEMREKRLAELLGAKVLWEFISAVTEEIEKQELESTPGLLEDLFIHVKETIQIQNMNKSITKAPVQTEADGINKDTLFMEAYVELINHKFVYLKTTVKNIGKKSTEDIYMHPSIKQLKFEGNAWNYAKEDGIVEKNIMTGEVDYLEPHGNGKSFYNIGSIRPGETVKVNLGYFVDEDKLDSIFLDAFNYRGTGDTENMNAKHRWWIDIRQ